MNTYRNLHAAFDDYAYALQRVVANRMLEYLESQ